MGALRSRGRWREETDEAGGNPPEEEAGPRAWASWDRGKRGRQQARLGPGRVQSQRESLESFPDGVRERLEEGLLLGRRATGKQGRI